MPSHGTGVVEELITRYPGYGFFLDPVDAMALSTGDVDLAIQHTGIAHEVLLFGKLQDYLQSNSLLK